MLPVGLLGNSGDLWVLLHFLVLGYNPKTDFANRVIEATCAGINGTIGRGVRRAKWQQDVTNAHVYSNSTSLESFCLTITLLDALLDFQK